MRPGRSSASTDTDSRSKCGVICACSAAWVTPGFEPEVMTTYLCTPVDFKLESPRRQQDGLC